MLYAQGRTVVLCTATVDEDIPRWLRGKGQGWMTAEYSLLPASTGERTQLAVPRGRPAVVGVGAREATPVHISDLKDPPAAPTPLPLPAPPYAQIGELVRRYLGPVRRAGQGTLVNGTPNREALVLEKAGFEHFERHVVPAGDVVVRTADDIVAWAYYRSDSAPHLFGDRREEFERDLRAVLRQASPDSRFAERLPPTEIMTRRAPHRDRAG